MGPETAPAKDRRERTSNFEVLRIIAMMMVILQYIALYGGWPIVINQTFDAAPNTFFIQFIYHFGKIGVWIFVLITGYFMVNSNSHVLPKFLKLYLQVFTTSVIFDVAFILIGEASIDSVEWRRDLLPLISGNWWFASTYLIALPFIPFVNRMLRSLDRRQHLTLIVMLLLAWFLIPTFTHSSMYGSFVIMFMTMYIIGAFIRLYPESFNRKPEFYASCTLASIALMAALIMLVDLVGPIENLRPFESTLAWGSDSSVIVVLVATLTFLTFRQIDVGCIRWVNLVASTTFGIYLIQEHHLFREWIFGVLDMGAQYDSICLVPYVLLCMVLIFSVCGILEFARMQTVDRVTARIIPALSKAIYRIQSRIVDGPAERVRS